MREDRPEDRRAITPTEAGERRAPIEPTEEMLRAMRSRINHDLSRGRREVVFRDSAGLLPALCAEYERAGWRCTRTPHRDGRSVRVVFAAAERGR